MHVENKQLIKEKCTMSKKTHAIQNASHVNQTNSIKTPNNIPNGLTYLANFIDRSLSPIKTKTFEKEIEHQRKSNNDQ